MKHILFLLLVISPFSLIGQGVQLNTVEAQISYTLYSNENSTFLINNCGGIIQQWPFGRNDMEHHSKLLEDGTLMFISNDEKRIMEYSFEGELLNIVKEEVPNILLNYEVIKLENGNYLTIGREVLSIAEIEELGYSTQESNPRYMDMILELNPQGDIVWQWNIKDHMIQQRNSSLANYGIVAQHPELLDMDVPLQSVDWGNYETFMINGFDYNPDLDQVIISVRKMGEIAIIDHSTTTEEAAGHTGGNYGKGGDIIWRWGNPLNYGVVEDRFLYYQHNPKWIKHGPYKNMISCYNNGLDRPGGFSNRYSQIPVIDTKISNGVYSLEDGQYSKEGLQLVYDKDETDTDFYSSYTSGAEFLPNGNIHVTVGQRSRMFEINPSGKIVWDYYILNSGYIFRSEKYTVDYPAFEGRDMTPIGQISSTYDCELYTETVDLSPDLSIDYIVTQDYIKLNSGAKVDCFIYNTQGQQIYKCSFINKEEIDISNLVHGVYLLTFIDANNLSKTIKILK